MKKSVKQMIQEWFMADPKQKMTAVVISPAGQPLTAEMIRKIQNDIQWNGTVCTQLGRN